jgi:hypothetical protein
MELLNFIWKKLIAEKGAFTSALEALAAFPFTSTAAAGHGGKFNSTKGTRS